MVLRITGEGGEGGEGENRLIDLCGFAAGKRENRVCNEHCSYYLTILK